MSQYLTIFCVFLSVFALNAQNETHAPGALGIRYTSEMQMCGDTVQGFMTTQYYQIQAKNEKSSQQILGEWQRYFRKTPDFKESGFLTIRFILDCHGKPRAYTFYEMGLDYQKKVFPDTLKTQVWAFVQQLGGFPEGVYTYKNQKYNVNYYYYFIFKIRNGEFESIAP